MANFSSYLLVAVFKPYHPGGYLLPAW